MAAALLSGFNIGDTLGVTFLGVCVSSMLYGVTCLQTWHYYRSSRGKSDGWLMWHLVTALLVFDSAHQAIVIHAVYSYLVLDFANPVKVFLLVWSVPTEVVFNAILALILNGFLTVRIWKVSHMYSLTLVAAILSCANFGTNLAYAIRGYFQTQFFVSEIVLRHHGIAGLSISVTTETMISFSLAFYLQSRRTGLRKSNDMIGKLVAVSITTGLLTAAFNLAGLIAYIAAPHALYVLFFNFMLGKLYANSLLTSLNSREYVMGKSDDSQPTSDHETLRLPTLNRFRLPGRTTDNNGNTALTQVHIAMDRFVVTDADSDNTQKFHE